MLRTIVLSSEKTMPLAAIHSMPRHTGGKRRARSARRLRNALRTPRARRKRVGSEALTGTLA